jgi:hypothetical protein
MVALTSQMIYNTPMLYSIKIFKLNNEKTGYILCYAVATNKWHYSPVLVSGN